MNQNSINSAQSPDLDTSTGVQTQPPPSQVDGNAMSPDSLNDDSAPSARARFSSSEDTRILRLQQQNLDWNQISQQLGNRSARQCRERFQNYLDPDLNTTTWTQDEDDLLILKESEMGKKWKKMMPYFKNRSNVNIKNRFATLQNRKKASEKMGEVASEINKYKQTLSNSQQSSSENNNSSSGSGSSNILSANESGSESTTGVNSPVYSTQFFSNFQASGSSSGSSAASQSPPDALSPNSGINFNFNTNYNIRNNNNVNNNVNNISNNDYNMNNYNNFNNIMNGTNEINNSNNNNNNTGFCFNGRKINFSSAAASIAAAQSNFLNNNSNNMNMNMNMNSFNNNMNSYNMNNNYSNFAQRNINRNTSNISSSNNNNTNNMKNISSPLSDSSSSGVTSPLQVDQTTKLIEDIFGQDNDFGSKWDFLEQEFSASNSANSFFNQTNLL